MFHSEIGASISSIEHILRTQYFLQRHNIKYFFTNFVDENIVSDFLKTHPEIEYLYKLIDQEYYLPVSSEFTWCVQNTKYSHLWHNPKLPHWEHPATRMHKEFVDQVIVPWLKEKYAGMVFNG